MRQLISNIRSPRTGPWHFPTYPDIPRHYPPLPTFPVVGKCRIASGNVEVQCGAVWGDLIYHECIERLLSWCTTAWLCNIGKQSSSLLSYIRPMWSGRYISSQYRDTDRHTYTNAQKKNLIVDICRNIPPKLDQILTCYLMFFSSRNYT